MRQRLMSIIIVFALPLALFLPVRAQTSAPAVAQSSTALQGEIAYVLDGNIWLLDLVTHKAQQLTKDGDNRWPTWSTDGRYLLYTHGKGEEQSDLYIWDLEKATAPRLLAKDACCAAWKPDEERIAYLASNGDNLSLNTIQPDGAGQATLLPKVDYERGVSPKGNLLWLDNQLLIPLEIVAGSAQNGLAVQTWLFQVDQQAQALTPFHAIAADCSLLNAAVGLAQDKSTYLATAFEGKCENTTHNKGILLAHPADAPSGQELPGLAYPAFSPDSRYLVAERYAEAEDYADAQPTGLVLHNLADNSETMLIAGGAQPAWRPAPPVDPAVARFVQPGERVVTLEPALTWQGATYRVHVLTKDEARLLTPAIFTAPNAEALTKRGITALIVTKDGQVVNDAATLRQVFLLYTSAYLLYEQPPVDFDPKINGELSKVLDNPIFQAVAVSELWKTRRAQTTEALRTLLTDQVSAKTTLDPLLEQAFATTPKQVETALDAFGAAVDNRAASDAVLLALKPDLAAAYQAAADTAKGRKIELQFLRFAARLLFISHLQEERATWLAIYADAFPNGAGALDRDQIRAAATAMDETKKSSTQRANIAGDFLLELGADQLLNLTGAAANKAATALVTHVSEKAGAEIAANAVAGVLSSVVFGVALGNLLYGSDELYADFMLARRDDELRATFRSGRTAVQTNAATAKHAQDQLVYNGDLAAQFRSAYLLETLAAVQAQRAYADGVTATFRLPNGVELLNWLRGEDWQKAVDGLRKSADATETQLIQSIGTPIYLDGAVALALGRVSKAPTVIVGNRVTQLLVNGDMLWAATDGGVGRWDARTGSYYGKLTIENGLADNLVLSMLQSQDDMLWFGTVSGGVSQLDSAGHWKTFTSNDGLASNFVSSMLQSQDGVLWFGTRNGVSRLESNGRWTTFTTKDGLASNAVDSIIQSQDGALWFGTRNGVSRLESNGRWTTFTTKDGLASNAVNSILQNTDGSLWFGTSSGVSRLDTAGHWKTFTTKDGLTDNTVNSMLQSQDGALWFGTDGGMSRLDTAGHWMTFTTQDGLADNRVSTIVQSQDGAFWFGTDGGIGRFADHYVAIGNKYDAARQWPESIDVYRQALIEQETPSRLLFMGRSLVEQAKEASWGTHKLPEALQWKDVLLLLPEDTRQLGMSDLLRAAEVVLIESQQIDPKNSEPRSALARLYRTWADLSIDAAQKQKLLDKSLEEYNMAVTLSPNAANLWNEKGNCHLARGERDQAEAAYLHSLSLNPQFDQTYLLLADFYDHDTSPAGRQKGIAFLRDSIKKMPNNPQLYSYLGVALAQTNDITGSIAANQKVIALQPGNMGAMRNLVLLYRNQGKAQDALQMADKALSLLGQNNLADMKQFRQLEAEIYQSAGQTAQVIAQYEQIRQADPKDLSALQNLSNLYGSTQNLNKMVEVTEVLMGLEPQNYKHPLVAAQAMQKWGQVDNARKLAEQALALAPADQKPTIQQFIALLK